MKDSWWFGQIFERGLKIFMYLIIFRRIWRIRTISTDLGSESFAIFGGCRWILEDHHRFQRIKICKRVWRNWGDFDSFWKLLGTFLRILHGFRMIYHIVSWISRFLTDLASFHGFWRSLKDFMSFEPIFEFSTDLEIWLIFGTSPLVSTYFRWILIDLDRFPRIWQVFKDFDRF